MSSGINTAPVIFGIWLLCLPCSATDKYALDRPVPKDPTIPVKRFILKAKPGHWEKVNQLHINSKARVVRTLRNLNDMQVIELAAGNKALENYRNSRSVEFIEPDIHGRSRALPHDPLLLYSPTNRVLFEAAPTLYARDTYQWHLANTGQALHLYEMISAAWVPVVGTEPANTNASIHALEAWGIRDSAAGVVIAVIDSGVDLSHPDLAGILWSNDSGQLSCFATSQDPPTNGPVYISNDVADHSGHGTQMTGIIAADWNEAGIAGVAPGARILIAKTSTYSAAEILICMDYCMGMGARIINCSWGFDQESASLKEAFAQAQRSGILCVCAVLNESVDYDTGLPDYPIQWRQTPSNPSGLNNIMAVTSTSPSDRRYASAWGLHSVDLGAPGRAIPCTTCYPAHGYVYVSGSSAATAITSGCAALLMAQHPEETYQHIICRLRASVDRIPDLDGKTLSGGRLNLYKALAVPPVQIVFLGIDDSGGHLQVRNGVPGITYTVQCSNDFKLWTDLTSFVGNGSAVQIDDPFLANHRFYRVVF